MRDLPGWRRERRLHDQRADLDAELQHHIDGRVEEYKAAGLSESEARERAQAAFGDVDDIRARCAAEDGRRKRRPKRERKTEPMTSTVQDLKLAARVLLKRPGYTAAILATLVLGIGATTAIFSVVNGVLLQPLPHPNPEELVLIYEVDGRGSFFEDRNPVTPANFKDWQEQNRVFRQMAAFQNYLVTYTGDGDPERVMGGWGTADFFSILGVSPLLGRSFLPADMITGAPDVILLSYDFWTTRLSSDSSVIGQTIRVGNSTPEVVGVLPQGFEFLDSDFAVYSPLRMTDSQLQNRRGHWMRVIARMNPGVTIDAAQKDMDRVFAGLLESYPEFLRGWAINVLSMTDEVVGDIRPALLVLLGAVGLVLLIAAVNVANLMLARATVEQREMAIRAALGAGRKRLIAQKLTESVVLAFAGGSLGFALSAIGTKALVALAPQSLPNVERIGVDARVLIFALAVSVLTGVLFGIVPALYASNTDASTQIREGGRSSTGTVGHRRLRASFVVIQLALSLVLLISAGLMLTTFIRLMRVDPGFESKGLLTMRLTIPASQYPTRAVQGTFYEQLLSEIQALPGVQSAGVSRFLPMGEAEWTWSVYFEGDPPPAEGEKRDYGYHVVSPDYFRTMGITLKRGRHLNPSDNADAPPVMIVNEAFVHRFFPNGGEALGKRMSILGREQNYMEIVGVVEDVHQTSLDVEPLPAYYGSYAQIPWDWFITEMGLAVRTFGDPKSLVPSVRDVIRRVGREVAVNDIRPMQDRVVQSVARSRFAMVLLGLFAVVAMSLAVVGIYGVISYSVGQRSQEIGVRMAMGAEPRRIIGLVIKQGAVLTAVGIGAGLVGAVALTRFQSSLLYGVTSADPLTYAGLALLLGLVALLATYLPARRASRVDPMRVLRE